ncbi:hypothetical protein [Mitsuokella jalaludinii]|jgi:hypothetical protein
MKKAYEKPTATAVSFQLEENVMFGGDTSVVPTPPDLESIFDKVTYQLHP